MIEQNNVIGHREVEAYIIEKFGSFNGFAECVGIKETTIYNTFASKKQPVWYRVLKAICKKENQATATAK